jgi:hypothetical protein
MLFHAADIGDGRPARSRHHRRRGRVGPRAAVTAARAALQAFGENWRCLIIHHDIRMARRSASTTVRETLATTVRRARISSSIARDNA